MTDTDNSPPRKRTRRMAREPQADATIPGDTPGTAGASKRASRSILVLDLLAREEGATMDELITATGWLPHTTRGADGASEEGTCGDQRESGWRVSGLSRPSWLMARQPYLTLGRLAELPLEDLNQEWVRRHGTPAPNLSPDLLRLGISYKLQEQRQGGISRSTRSLLRQFAAQASAGAAKAPLPRKLTPGTRLVRDWHGVGHTVVVLADGFEYDGRHWKSLTAIAKAITGNQWNGPLFFGLTQRKKKA